MCVCCVCGECVCLSVYNVRECVWVCGVSVCVCVIVCVCVVSVCECVCLSV